MFHPPLLKEKRNLLFTFIVTKQQAERELFCFFQYARRRKGGSPRSANENRQRNGSPMNEWLKSVIKAKKGAIARS
jgi:hypothetical protein